LLCNYCGLKPARIINPEGTGACEQCAPFFNTCYLCTNNALCEFETNPSPIPKQVQQVIRQGNITAQAVIRNPEREEAFCTACTCWNGYCSRQFGCCGNYNEYIPNPTVE
jgi:hypothetical protein